MIRNEFCGVRLRPPGGVRRSIYEIRNKYFPLLSIPYKLPWGGWLLLGQDEFSQTIFWGTHQEQDELNVVTNLLRPGMVFFDLGANQGLYSISAGHKVRKEGRVYAFEPVPSEYRKLQANIRLNLATNIIAEHLAIGRYDDTTQMYACEPSKAMYSSLVRPAVSSEVKVQCISVRSISLDTYTFQNRIDQIDILKMDVEGAERDVLEGGRQVFTQQRPIVLCEFSDRRTEPWGYRAREIADILMKYGYRWFEPISNGVRSHVVKDYYDYDDLIAVPEEKLSMIAHLVHHDL